MAIVPLIKVTLCGPATEKDAVLDRLQSLACLHLIDLRARAAETVEVEHLDRDARAALQYLRDSSVCRRAQQQRGRVDIEAVVKEALDIRGRSRALAEEREQLHKWIADIEPWGDFELPEWAADGALRFWFYIVPRHQAGCFDAITMPWGIVAQDHRFAYAVVIANEQPANMPVAPVPLEPRSLAKLRMRLAEVERELEELDYRRIGLTLYTEVLSDAWTRATTVPPVAGPHAPWSATNCSPCRVGCPGGGLRRCGNSRRASARIDNRAAQRTRQPSHVVGQPAGAARRRRLGGILHDALIPLVGPVEIRVFRLRLVFRHDPLRCGICRDIGRDLARHVAAHGAHRKRSQPARRVAAVVFFSIIYGVLVGTYFGMGPPAGSWLALLHVLDANDQRLMMWLAIGVGAAHLLYANLVAAWWRRHSATALSALGWAAVFLGGLCAGLANSYSELTFLGGAGLWALALGGLLVLLFTSERPLSLAPAQLFGRLVDGLRGITGLSKAFGDALSYLRLFALGLASIKLAEAFNGLAATAFESGGVGLLLGLLVLLVGHGINFAMGVMSGVVHGLRLNLIEFFNWSLPEEGEQFRAFRKKALKAAE